jgi:uncharacterized RDD family membrane protein YckC
MSISTTNQANPYAPPKAFVQDVVDSGDALEPAGRGRRFWASMIDSFIWAFAIYLPLLFGGIFDFERVRFAPEAVPVVAWIILGLAVIAVAALNIYYVNQNGQSLAKKWLGIKVVRTDGSPAMLGRIFWLRNFVSWLPGIVLGGLWTLIDSLFIFGEKRQCLHDKIADTIVVNA